jgi:threonine dehydrogenase-like Zn-dependent dehydrogenase
VVSVVGIFQQPVSVNAPRMTQKNLVMSMGMGDLGNIGRLVALIEAGRLDLTPLITHTFSLDQAMDAYKIFAERTDGAVKVLLKP